jgi:ATP synthase subunit D
VNALQYIFIPNYIETVAFIEATLEEREREETFRLKLLKHRTARPALGQSTSEADRTSRSSFELGMIDSGGE